MMVKKTVLMRALIACPFRVRDVLTPPARCFGDRRERSGEYREGEEDGDKTSLHRVLLLIE